MSYISLGKAEEILAELEQAKAEQDAALQAWWQTSPLRSYLESKAAEHDTVEREPVWLYYDIDASVQIDINVINHVLSAFRIIDTSTGRALNSQDDFLSVYSNTVDPCRGSFDPDSPWIRAIDAVLLEAANGKLAEILKDINLFKRRHPKLYEAVFEAID